MNKVLWYRNDLIKRGFHLKPLLRVEQFDSIKTYGKCITTREGCIIKLSPMATEETIVHELLHTVVGSRGHGKVFQRNADIVNEIYGMNIGTYCSESESNNSLSYRLAKCKYAIKCNSCGKIFTYSRKCKAVNNTINGIRMNHKNCKRALFSFVPPTFQK